MAGKPPPPPEKLEACLLTLALVGGNAEEASRHLALMEPPIKVASATLKTYKRKYAERYAEIQSDRQPLIEGVVLQRVRDTILQAAALQNKTLERLLAAVEAGELEAKGLSTVLKAAGVSLGINVEKMLLLTNRPTVIAEKRDVAEILESVSKRVPGLIEPIEAIEATAVDITEQGALETPKGPSEDEPEDGGMDDG